VVVASAKYRRIFSWGLALVALAFVVYVVPLRDHCDAQNRCEPGVLAIVGRSNAPLLGALFAAYMASTAIWSARWRRLLVMAGVRPTLAWVWRVTLQSVAASVILPGGFGGDALRVAAALGVGAPAPVAVGSVLFDRAIGLATLAALGALAGVTLRGSTSVALVFVLACVPVGFAVGVLVLRSEVVRSSRWLDRGLLAKSMKPMVAYLSAPKAGRSLIGGVLLSLVVSATQLGINRGLIAAVGATPSSEPAVFIGMTIVFTTAVLPLLPGGWGTVDAAYVYFLGRAGIAAPIALAVCLLYRTFWYLSATVGALALFARPVTTTATLPPRPTDGSVHLDR
jgi:uncharacterized protein (TIRG00374 family)